MAIGLHESGAYLLVAGCTAAAAWWLWRYSGTKTPVANPPHHAAAHEIDRSAWREFEALAGEAFRLQGYQVLDSTRGSVDGGGELILRRERETFLVQCRHWQEAKVSADAVHALERAMAARGASGGFLLTKGRFARDAIACAAGGNVRLIDGPTLTGLLGKARAARGSS